MQVYLLVYGLVALALLKFAAVLLVILVLLFILAKLLFRKKQ